jgi:hypothetical protein
MDEVDSSPDKTPVGRVSAHAEPALGFGSAFDARIGMRNYFSTYLFWTGLQMTTLAAAIEAAHSGQSRFDLRHRGYVLSAILAAEGFLEAMVNELFQDAVDEHNLSGDGYLAPLSRDTHLLMARMWQATDGGRGLGPLDKYDLLLAAVGMASLDRGRNPYQDAQMLGKLRNAVAHYQPEHLFANVPHRLKGKFAANALMAGAGSPWWPDHCLGAGCAGWAIQTATALADYVASAVGITPNYQRIRQRGWMGQPPDSSP